MATVERYLSDNLHTLTSLVPSIRDGSETAIHDARVATRRLRAALPVVASVHSRHDWDDIARTLKRAGRALGRARDVDVAIALLSEVERRAPSSAAAAGALRARLIPKQLKTRRALIERFESIDVAALGFLAREIARGPRTIFADARGAYAAVSELAADLRQTIDRASGVYFPKRAHDVRIAAKKLRYALELLGDRHPATRRMLKQLRAAQEALGAAHDREVLIDRLDRVERRHEIPASSALREILEAEAREYFGEYAAIRARITELDAPPAWTRKGSLMTRRLSRRALVAGAVAVPSIAAIVLAARGNASSVDEEAHPTSSSATRRPARTAAWVSNA